MGERESHKNGFAIKAVYLRQWILVGKLGWVKTAAIIIMARLSIRENLCQLWRRKLKL